MIAMLALPAALSAQQREHTPAATTGTPATGGGASDPAPRKPAPPRSLMGKVMATLIDSAQRPGSAQQSESPGAAPPAKATASSVEAAGVDAPAAGQVAVQTVP